jgi:menaquinone-dependent protoporphyrinogen oxidase
VIKILILHASSEGQTRKIATFLADRLRGRACDVTLVDIAARQTDLRATDFDAAILAGRVHAGTFPRKLERFAREQAAVLSAMPSAFVPVSMMAARSDEVSRKAASHYVHRFLEKTGWTPQAVQQTAGARRYSQHGRLTGWILRAVDKWAGFPGDTSRDHEWTDWPALAAFADAFLSACNAAERAVARMACGTAHRVRAATVGFSPRAKALIPPRTQ